MFDDPRFDRYQYEDIPRERDVYLVDERYAPEYEAMYLTVFGGGECRPVGYVGSVAVRHIREDSLDLSWYANTTDRFHEVPLSLPRTKIRYCVGCWMWDWKPTIFVDSSWLDQLYAKKFSVFGLIDAIGVRSALDRQELTREKLLSLRASIDHLAARHTEIAFISFGDSVVVKSNWTVGTFKAVSRYTYRPEVFIEVALQFQDIFRYALGLSCYSIFTQGYNEYYSDQLLHVSETRNHISLNSLGTPFARLDAIDKAVRNAIRSKAHQRAEVYLDDSFYHSLALRYEYDKNARPNATYTDPMSSRIARYYYADVRSILENLDPRQPA